MRSDRNKKPKINLVWLLTVLISAAILFVGNRLVSTKRPLLANSETAARAKVIELTFEVEDNHEESNYYSKYQYFNALILSGPHKGDTVECYQQTNSYNETGERFVRPGDRIILYNYGIGTNTEEWVFGSYARFDNIFVLMAVYLALVIFLGRTKGVNTIISLVYTCVAVFCIFLPAVINGINVYLMTVLVCIFTIVMTLLLTNGASKKSVSTMLGCGSGVLCAAILSIVFDRWMHLTGIIDEHSIYIKLLDNENGIDLRALIFAMITIGAMGAVMDVAMDIASSLYEIKYHAPEITVKELFKSGINIGRDVMGTMANTLVLAYIGSSLCNIILRVAYAGSIMELINTESIAVELMQAIVGSLGILLTIPLTALLSSTVYCGGHGSHSKV